MLAASMLAPAAPAAAQAAAPDALSKPFGVMFSGADAYRAALTRVCLPIIADRRPIEDVEAAEHLVRIGSSIVHASAADRVYRLPTIDFAIAVAWTDGTCSVSVKQGDSKAFRAAAAAALASRNEGFAAGRTTTTADGQDRTIWCAAARPFPVAVSVATPAAGAEGRVSAVSSTVNRSSLSDPADCRP